MNGEVVKAPGDLSGITADEDKIIRWLWDQMPGVVALDVGLPSE